MRKAVTLFLAIVSFSSLASEDMNKIKPVPFVALQKNSAQYAAVCHAVESQCGDNVKIWKEKGGGDAFYLTTAVNDLIKVEKTGNAYIKRGEWDFDDYGKNQTSPDDELTMEDISIYPALYPLSKTRQAVALVSKWSTAYSGGGREETYADFLMLNEDGTWDAAFKNIPFSSSEMIRACFSEEDYAKNSHCHDESWSTLTLKITDEGKEYYRWKFITKSWNWPSFTDKSTATVESSEQVKYPFQSEQ